MLARGTPLLLLAACGGSHGPKTHAPPADSPDRALTAIRYLPGEHMEWEVRWFGVLVGRVQLAVGQPGELEGKEALVIRSLATSDGALAVAKRGQMELVTWIDLALQLPLAQSGSFDEIYTGEVLGAPARRRESGGRARSALGGTTRDRAAKRAGETMSKFGAAEWPRTPWLSGLPDGEVAQSTHTALGLLRGWTPAVGDRGHVYVRMRWRLLRIDLRSVGRERVTSSLGRRPALRVDGVAVLVDGALAPLPRQRSFPLSFWIDDAGDERVPVRIDIESGFGGTVRLDLVTYDPPGPAIASVRRAAGR